MVIAAVAAVLSTSALAQAPRIVMEEMMVPSSDPGIEIYVRNKRPVDMTAFRSDRTVLFVHGSTYPAHTAFDLPLGGMSWMDYIAAQGYDVYLLDLRGYGKSTRPKEMSEKPETNPPIVRTDTAVKDISTVVDFILKRRNIAKLDLLGWSWGTTQMASFTIQNPAKVERLVLYAPLRLVRNQRRQRRPLETGSCAASGSQPRVLPSRSVRSRRRYRPKVNKIRYCNSASDCSERRSQ